MARRFIRWRGSAASSLVMGRALIADRARGRQVEGMTELRKPYLAGAWADTPAVAEVRSPFDGRVVSRVGQVSAQGAEAALAFAFAHRAQVAAQSTQKRRAVLLGIVERLKARHEEMARLICDEAGKPVSAARTEVRRAVETFTLAASVLPYFGGQTLPVDLDAASEGYECETRRFPAGLVVGIVPFNFPLNLGAHKVAPALAVGAPILVKPPPQAPSAQLLLAQLAQEAGADPAALQTLPCDNTVAEALATDPRVRVLSFTGSAKVGWHLKSKAPGKVVLELGGNAAALVWEDADLPWAIERCALGAFNYAGQICIKVQRLFVHARVYDAFREGFLARAQALPVGDPARDDTVVGPLIDDAAAARVEAWVDEAVAAGAKRLTPARREGRLMSPVVLEAAPHAAKVVREEVFGPVVVLSKVDDFEAALAGVNDTVYGLQAGLFTKDLGRTRRAFHALEVGGVIVNDYPTFRSDNYPYGGVKASGLGREGVRIAMEELTEERVLVTRVR
jgi:acyl-CoA reductase-like NAD-dependent aldehyde dehydrogenase